MQPEDLEQDENVVVRIPEAGDALLTVQEVAELLEVSPETLLDWATAGKGPPFYSWARTPFYRQEEVVLWLLDQGQHPVTVLIEGRKVRH